MAGEKLSITCLRIWPGRVVRVKMLEHIRRQERTHYLVMASGRAFNIHHKTKNTEMKSQLNIALKSCFVVVAGLVLSACQNQPTTANAADPAGVYGLISVNGKPVPASVSHEGATLQVRSGTFTINADGTCGTKTVFVPPSGTEIARQVSATYTKDGSKLTMQWKGAGKTVGTVQGNTFTMDNEGMVFVYRK
jgi:hypothetical protein